MVDTPTREKTDVRPMSDSDRQEVHRMHQQGKGVREIARHFNRAPSTVSRILREAGGGGSVGTRTRGGTSRQRTGGATAKSKPKGTTPSMTSMTSGTAKARTGAKSTTRRSGGATPARSTGGTGVGATISRQELRSLEQRISRIENSLSRMSNMLQVSSRRSTGTTSQSRKSK